MTNNNRTIVVPYERFSSDAQADGDSIRRQSDAIKKYIEQHGYTLDKDLKFSDHGVSGLKGDNIKKGGDLAKVLNLLEEGKFPEPQKRILLVEKFDRLSRLKPFEVVDQIILPILKKGLAIATVKENQLVTLENINKPSIYYPLLSLLDQANAYAETVRYHLQKTYDKKFMDLKEHGTIMKHELPAWLCYNDDKTKILEVDEKVAIMQTMFEMALNGKTSVQIHNYFLDNEIALVSNRSKSGKWALDTIYRYLRNPAVTGRYTSKHRQGFTKEGYFPQIITVEDFEKVQAIMDSRTANRQKGTKRGTRTLGKDGKAKNLFSGLAKCPNCGYGLSIKTNTHRDKKGKYALRCNGKKTRNGCTFKQVPYVDLETAIIKHIKQLDLHAILSNHSIVDDIPVHRSKLEVKKRRYAIITKQLDNDDLINDEEYEDLLIRGRKVNREIKELEQKIRAEEMKSIAVPSFDDIDIDNLLIACEFEGKEPDWDARIKVQTNIRMIVDKIVMDDEKIKGMPRVHQIHFKNGAVEVVSVTNGEAGSIYIEKDQRTTFGDETKDYDFENELEPVTETDFAESDYPESIYFDKN